MARDQVRGPLDHLQLQAVQFTDLERWIERCRFFLARGGAYMSVGIPRVLEQALVLCKLRATLLKQDWDALSHILLRHHQRSASDLNHIYAELQHIYHAWRLRTFQADLFTALAEFASSEDLGHGLAGLQIDYHCLNESFKGFLGILKYDSDLLLGRAAPKEGRYVESRPQWHEESPLRPRRRSLQQQGQGQGYGQAQMSPPQLRVVLSDEFFQQPTFIASKALWRLMNAVLHKRWFVKQEIYNKPDQRIAAKVDPFLFCFFGLADSDYVNNPSNIVDVRQAVASLAAFLGEQEEQEEAADTGAVGKSRSERKSVSFHSSSSSSSLQSPHQRQLPHKSGTGKRRRNSSKSARTHELRDAEETVFSVLVSCDWRSFPVHVQGFFKQARNRLVDMYVRADLSYYCHKGSAVLDEDSGNIALSELYTKFLQLSVDESARAVALANRLSVPFRWSAQTQKLLSAARVALRCRRALLGWPLDTIEEKESHSSAVAASDNDDDNDDDHHHNGGGGNGDGSGGSWVAHRADASHSGQHQTAWEWQRTQSCQQVLVQVLRGVGLLQGRDTLLLHTDSVLALVEPELSALERYAYGFVAESVWTGAVGHLAELSRPPELLDDEHEQEQGQEVEYGQGYPSESGASPRQRQGLQMRGAVVHCSSGSGGGGTVGMFTRLGSVEEVYTHPSMQALCDLVNSPLPTATPPTRFHTDMLQLCMLLRSGLHAAFEGSRARVELSVADTRAVLSAHAGAKWTALASQVEQVRGLLLRTSAMRFHADLLLDQQLLRAHQRQRLRRNSTSGASAAAAAFDEAEAQQGPFALAVAGFGWRRRVPVVHTGAGLATAAAGGGARAGTGWPSRRSSSAQSPSASITVGTDVVRMRGQLSAQELAARNLREMQHRLQQIQQRIASVKKQQLKQLSKQQRKQMQTEELAREKGGSVATIAATTQEVVSALCELLYFQQQQQQAGFAGAAAVGRGPARRRTVVSAASASLLELAPLAAPAHMPPRFFTQLRRLYTSLSAEFIASEPLWTATLMLTLYYIAASATLNSDAEAETETSPLPSPGKASPGKASPGKASPGKASPGKAVSGVSAGTGSPSSTPSHETKSDRIDQLVRSPQPLSEEGSAHIDLTQVHFVFSHALSVFLKELQLDNFILADTVSKRSRLVSAVHSSQAAEVGRGRGGASSRRRVPTVLHCSRTSNVRSFAQDFRPTTLVLTKHMHSIRTQQAAANAAAATDGTQTAALAATLAATTGGI